MNRFFFTFIPRRRFIKINIGFYRESRFPIHFKPSTNMLILMWLVAPSIFIKLLKDFHQNFHCIRFSFLLISSSPLSYTFTVLSNIFIVCKLIFSSSLSKTFTVLYSIFIVFKLTFSLFRSQWLFLGFLLFICKIFIIIMNVILWHLDSHLSVVLV